MEAALSSMDAAKKRLFEELAERNVNVLRVRALCRDYPGIIATTGLRIRIWTLLLLGPDYKISADENRDIKMPEEACDEQHVLEADGQSVFYEACHLNSYDVTHSCKLTAI